MSAPARAQSPYGIGRTATAAEIAGWNIDIGRDGANLPTGSGSVAHGHEVFDQQCVACHGEKGEGGVGDRLVGGQGTIATSKPIKTVGSYWPYAPTLFDYIRRAMPQNAPQSLSNDDVYAVSAYILHLNGLLAGRCDARRPRAKRDQDAEPGHVHRRPTARRQKSGMCDGLLTQTRVTDASRVAEVTGTSPFAVGTGVPAIIYMHFVQNIFMRSQSD